MVARVLDCVMLGSVLVALGCSCSGPERSGGNPGSGGTGGGTGTGATGGSGSIDPAPFLGSWNEAATSVVSGGACVGVDPITSTGPITVSMGTSSHLVRADDSCSIPLNVTSTSLATLARAAQCVIPAISGLGSGTVAFDTWTFAISGNTGTESASGTLTLGSVVCPLTLSASLTR